MNILAINPGHNGSAALLVDGELKLYIEEERLSRSKYDGNPFRGILEALKYRRRNSLRDKKLIEYFRFFYH